MKSKFSNTWKSSKNPRKQRKYVANAPLHIKRRMLSSKLSKELSKKYEKRNTIIRKGDKIKIMRGNFKNHSGRVEKVLTKYTRIYVEGVQVLKKDGNRTYYPIHPSNLMITELNLEDKQRQKMIGRGVKTGVIKK